MAAADQRNITAKASIADIAAEVKMTGGRVLETCSAQMFHSALLRPAALKQVGRWVTKQLTRR
jgi:hypothetical protein